MTALADRVAVGPAVVDFKQYAVIKGDRAKRSPR